MSNYVGTVGDKISVEVKLVNLVEYTDYKFSYYGTAQFIYIMEDAEGNVLTWKSTSSPVIFKDDEVEVIRKGDILSVTGKIKEHSEYKGVKQTVLTRCKISVVEKAPDLEEIKAQKREDQIQSLTGEDFIWEMPYKQYKEHYADCETVIGSYDKELGTIKVIIREGRLVNSGVRGKHFSGYKFSNAEGTEFVTYRAVSEENARKQMLKDFPENTDWECTRIFRYRG